MGLLRKIRVRGMVVMWLKLDFIDGKKSEMEKKEMWKGVWEGMKGSGVYI